MQSALANVMANLTSLNKLPNTQKKRVFVAAENGLVAVPDPDLEISGGPVIQTLRLGGGGRGVGAGLQKNFLFGLKIRGGAQAPPLDPPLG